MREKRRLIIGQGEKEDKREDYNSLDIHIYPADKKFHKTKIQNKLHRDILQKDLACLELARKVTENAFEKERSNLLNKLVDMKMLQRTYKGTWSPFGGSPTITRKQYGLTTLRPSSSAPNLSGHEESGLSLPKIKITSFEDEKEKDSESISGTLHNGLGEISGYCCRQGNCMCVRSRTGSLGQKIDYEKFPTLGKYKKKPSGGSLKELSNVRARTPQRQSTLRVPDTDNTAVSRVPTPWPGSRDRSRSRSHPTSLLQVPKISDIDERHSGIKKSRSADDVSKLDSGSPLLSRRVKMLRDESTSAPNSPVTTHRNVVFE